MSYVAPTSVRAFAPDWQRKPKREIEAFWVLNPEAEQHESVVRVRLTVSHSPESKRFRAVLTWETVETEGAFAVTSWSSNHAYVGVANQQVARYSKKALEEFFAQALATVEERYEHFEHVFAEAQAFLPVPEEV